MIIIETKTVPSIINIKIKFNKRIRFGSFVMLCKNNVFFLLSFTCFSYKIETTLLMTLCFVVFSDGNGCHRRYGNCHRAK